MKVINKETNKWIRPWDGYPDDIYNRDDRFFSLVIKGTLAFLSKNIVLYGKPIRHFIFNTGSSYMYVETNGYNYNITEVTDQDQMYMERPRCIVSIGTIGINTEELSQPYVRGMYERFDNGEIKGYNAEFKRIPITMQLTLKYVMSTFNEEITLAQELIDKLCFQKYFSIVYLGQTIKCSVEFPTDLQMELNQIDMASAEPNNKILEISVNICTNYPSIDENTEQSNRNVISGFQYNTGVHDDPIENIKVE